MKQQVLFNTFEIEKTHENNTIGRGRAQLRVLTQRAHRYGVGATRSWYIRNTVLMKIILTLSGWNVAGSIETEKVKFDMREGESWCILRVWWCVTIDDCACVHLICAKLLFWRTFFEIFAIPWQSAWNWMIRKESELDIFVEYEQCSVDSVEAYFNKYVVLWIVELQENEKNSGKSYALMEEKMFFSKILVCER